jgi:hypothetical protein
VCVPDCQRSKGVQTSEILALSVKQMHNTAVPVVALKGGNHGCVLAGDIEPNHTLCAVHVQARDDLLVESNLEVNSPLGSGWTCECCCRHAVGYEQGDGTARTPNSPHTKQPAHQRTQYSIGACASVTGGKEKRWLVLEFPVSGTASDS